MAYVFRDKESGKEYKTRWDFALEKTKDDLTPEVRCCMGYEVGEDPSLLLQIFSPLILAGHYKDSFKELEVVHSSQRLHKLLLDYFYKGRGNKMPASS